MGEICVQVVQGEILEERVQAIVLGTDSKFEMDDDVQSKMAKLGGPTL
jgi:O-acetyl-ADP-ribose deacetylase (regulator of RNase III)